MKISLIRTVCDENGILGVIFTEKSPSFYSLELPWRNNRREVSAVPSGQYRAKIRFSPKYGKCLEILKVPERTDILIHAGNTLEDTKGCILIGLGFRDDGRSKRLTDSRKALAAFLRFLEEDEELSLRIMDLKDILKRGEDMEKTKIKPENKEDYE